MVTLIGTTKQYIIAEATKTISLMNDSQHAEGDELWFGNAFISREGGISADAMYPEPYTAYDPDGSAYTAPALVASDISAHEKYKSRGYAGHGVNFYCGVPITTNHGQVIGVYTVTDDKPRDSVSATELRFLVDMSCIVIQHLETVRNERARRRGQRLIHGIGAFIEGDMVVESSAASIRSRRNSGSQPGDESAAKKQRPTLERSGLPPPPGSKLNDFLGLVISDANTLSEEQRRLEPNPSDRADGSIRSKTTGFSQESLTLTDQDVKPTTTTSRAAATKARAILQSQQVFHRAAAILRYSLGSDGVVMFNASSANLSSGSKMESSGAVSRVHHYRSKERRRTVHHEQAQSQRPTNGTVDIDSSVSDEDTGSTRSHSDSSSTSQRKRQPKCEILGLSTLDPDHEKIINIPEQALRRLVRRHPKGKCFTFDQFGKPASSDESSESASATDGLTWDSAQTLRAGRHAPATNGLVKILPGSRSVVFVPLWDIAKERWHSGILVWSNDPRSLTNVEDDMVYLKAFGNAVLNEVSRIDLALSDTAKSTFLANISHELRSPLHGILGSIEFLHDTAMDDFQSSMVISVETCGKTLLDTVNHVLDYAKIHSLSKAHRRAKANKPGVDQSSRPETSLTEDFDMAIIVEEAVEAVYAGQVFRTANGNSLEGESEVQTAASRAMQQRHERRANISKGSAQQKSPVRLTLNIDDHTNWKVRSQPGAVRRIVMNILGNSLKYTSKGSINVALEIDRSRSRGSSNLHMTLKISDTGQGMSDDFMKNHAFTAFSQENSLATGTGLGLSIVRQIVDSIGGKIDLSSEKDVGTEVRVGLSLPKSQKDLDANSQSNAVPPVREQTKGLEMCMLSPDEERSSDNGVRSLVPLPTIEGSMRNLVSQWFRMKVTSRKSMEGTSPDFFIYPEPPPIDYLMDFHGSTNMGREVPVIILTTNAFEAASLRSNGVHELTDIGKVIEIIAQPCGPQKLARVLQRCMQRVEKLYKQSSKSAGLSTNGVEKGDNDNNDDDDDGKKQDSREHLETDSTQGLEKGLENQQAHVHPESRPNLPHTQSLLEDRSNIRRPSLSKMGETSQAEGLDGDGIPRTLDMADRPRVLVVDDNHINLHLLATFVRKSGHPFESATDGLQALEAYKESCQADSGRQAFRYVLVSFFPVSQEFLPLLAGFSFPEPALHGSGNIYPEEVLLVILIELCNW